MKNDILVYIKKIPERSKMWKKEPHIEKKQKKNKLESSDKEKKYDYTNPKDKAHLLTNNYRKHDRLNDREFNLPKDFVLNNILNKPCYYCGEKDWNKIGCDRIHNTIGHTIDNVIPCCYKCNKERGNLNFYAFCSIKGIKLEDSFYAKQNIGLVSE